MKSLSICLVAMLGALSGCSHRSSDLESNFLGESKSAFGVDGASTAAAESNKKNIQDIYAQLGALLKISMLDCPGRIWPGYDWKKMNVLMLQKDAPSWIWKGSSGQLEPLPESEVPSGARQGLFSFFDWHGERAVAIYHDGSETGGYFSSAKLAFQLIVHEGFHLLGQNDWATPSGLRGTTYPIDATPRMYRRMIFTNLVSYFESHGTNTQSLQKAAFWFQKWKAEFPGEVAASTDGYEGTARYVEYLSSSLVEARCDSNDDVLLDKLSQKILDPNSLESLGKFVSSGHLELDSEGYDIGSLAAFILRFIQKDPNWYANAKNGKSPLESLLQNVETAVDSIPPTTEAEYRKSQNLANSKMAPWINTEISNDADKNFLRLVFSADSAKGSYSPKGFYLPTALPGVTLMPLALPYEFKLNDWSMMVQADKVLRNTVGTNPCNGGSFETLIAKSDIAIENGTIKIARNDIHGEMRGTEVTDENGFSWFCGE